MSRCLVCKKDDVILAAASGPGVGICVRCKPNCHVVGKTPDGREQIAFTQTLWRQLQFRAAPSELSDDELIGAMDALRDFGRPSSIPTWRPPPPGSDAAP